MISDYVRWHLSVVLTTPRASVAHSPASDTSARDHGRGPGHPIVWSRSGATGKRAAALVLWRGVGPDDVGSLETAAPA